MSGLVANRRAFLRGAGMTLALPWLETFAPRTAHAQAAAARKRYIVLYFPNGTADFWHPTGSGAGDAWKLSPILDPLASVKKYVSVLQNVGYQEALRNANPSHSQMCASMLTCAVPDGNASVIKNGTSIDQIIAQTIGGATTLASLQVGLSTLDSYDDGRHPANSRSISWASPTQPLYKMVNPQAVFDRLMSGGAPPGGTTTDPLAARRRDLKKSVLDYVLENSASLKNRLGQTDRIKVDEFMSSVRVLEKRVQDSSVSTGAAVCQVPARPGETYGVGQVPSDYSRDKHASIMIDLVVFALQCDLTRVVTFMLDDARSDFSYNFLKTRKFTDAGSSAPEANAGAVAGFHGLQHAGDRNDGYATINYWLTQKAAELTTKLAAVQEGATSVMDNSVIVYGSGMHGGNHQGIDIPLALIGSGGGVLKTNQFYPWPNGQLLANVHLTLMQKVFGLTAPSFGPSTGIIDELLV